MKNTLFILIFLCVQTIFAYSFDGDISKSKNKNYVVLQDTGARYQVTGQTPIISSYLNKLSEGDFISVDGTLSADQNLLTVQSINYVGLRALLGTWSGDDNHCYNFTSHTDFTVSMKIGDYCLNSRSSDYTYLLNPNTYQWVMLVSGDYNSYVGDVDFITKQSVEIDLYDSQTGDILRKLKLQKK
ncbi:MAG: hypothetical protein ACXVAX_00330 [Pseudobdellovibrio sp.]